MNRLHIETSTSGDRPSLQMPQISQQNQYQLNLFLCEFRCSRKNVGKNSCSGVSVIRCFGVPVFRGLVMSVFFVGVGTMMPTVENWPVKTIKTAFLIKRAKSANFPVYLRINLRSLCHCTPNN